MIRQERRRKIREYEKELLYIRKHTPYIDFKIGSEFDLPQEEIELLAENKHEDKNLQKRFNYAAQLFGRVDALENLIYKLKHYKEENHVRR